MKIKCFKLILWKTLMLLYLLRPDVVGAQRIVFTPQWTPQAQFAGYYVAYDKGFYQEAGVDVDIQHPSASYSAFNRLLEGSSDMITQQLVQAMMQIDRGMPLVNVLQTSQQNALMIISYSDSIRSLEHLKGKRIGVWKTGGFGELVNFLDVDMGLDIQWVTFLSGINLYLSGALDATLGMSYNEYLQIKASGYENKPVIRLSDTEYNFPEDGLYVTEEYYRKNPDKVKAFVEASRKGWEWAHEHPEETLDIVMRWAEKEKVHTNRIHQQWMLEEILRLQCAKGESTPSFHLSAEVIEKLSSLLMKHRRIYQPISLEKLKGGMP